MALATNRFQALDFVMARVTITNLGTREVSLVAPGDGSEHHWRTPLIGWSILPLAAVGQQHPMSPPKIESGRCGHTSPARVSEVFALKSGESHQFETVLYDTTGLSPGSYRAVFLYRNAPELKVRGVPLEGPHDPAALEVMRRSTPCSLVSPEIQFEIVPRTGAPQGIRF